MFSPKAAQNGFRSLDVPADSLGRRAETVVLQRGHRGKQETSGLFSERRLGVEPGNLSQEFQTTLFIEFRVTAGRPSE